MLRRLAPTLSGGLLVVACAYAMCWAFVQGIGIDEPLQYDLDIYRAAIAERAAGNSLYDYANWVGDSFNYPPFAALALWPLHWLGKVPSGIAWTIITLVATAFMVLALERAARGPWERGSAALRRRFPLSGVLLALLLVSSASLSNLLWGQLGALLTAVVLADVLGFLPRWLTGWFIGLAAAVKLTALLFIPYLLLNRRYRDAVRASLVFTGAALVAWAVLPRDSWRFWSYELTHMTVRVWDIGHIENQSLYGFVTRFGFDPTTTRVVFAVLAVAILAFCAVQVRRLAAHDPVLAALITGCVSLLLSPITWVHHMYWAVLIGAWLVLEYRGVLRVLGWAAILLMLRPMAWEEVLVQDDPIAAVYGNTWLLVAAAGVFVTPLLARRRPPPGPAAEDRRSPQRLRDVEQPSGP